MYGRPCEAYKGKIQIVACDAGLTFAEKIASELERMCTGGCNTELGGFVCPGGVMGERGNRTGLKETHFANTEVKTIIDDSIGGSRVFIVQDVENSTCGKYQFVYESFVSFARQEETKTGFKQLFHESFGFELDAQYFDQVYSNFMDSVSFKKDFSSFEAHLTNKKGDDNSYVAMLKSIVPGVRSSDDAEFNEFLSAVGGKLLSSQEFFTRHSVNDNFMALKTAIDAAKEARASEITAVLPVFPYARQDKVLDREGLTARMVSREIEDAGMGVVKRVLTMDIHNRAIRGFFRTAQLETLYSSKNLIAAINDIIGFNDMVCISPDIGGATRARHVANKTGSKMGIIYKERDYSNPSTIASAQLIGDIVQYEVDPIAQLREIDRMVNGDISDPEVARQIMRRIRQFVDSKGKGLSSLIIDDLVATFGTGDKGCRLVKEEGAMNVSFAAALSLLNHPALVLLDRLHSDGVLNYFFTTNAVTHDRAIIDARDYYIEVPVEDVFAEAIFRIEHNGSVSKMYD